MESKASPEATFVTVLIQLSFEGNHAQEGTFSVYLVQT